jgi:hypothetical protein
MTPLSRYNTFSGIRSRLIIVRSACAIIQLQFTYFRDEASHKTTNEKIPVAGIGFKSYQGEAYRAWTEGQGPPSPILSPLYT